MGLHCLVLLLMTNVSVWQLLLKYVLLTSILTASSGLAAQLVFLSMIFKAVNGVGLNIFYFNLVRYTYKYIQVTECIR